MPYRLDDKMVIAVSSRAMFDLDEEHRVFQERGEREYRLHQLQRLDLPAKAGVAFRLARKLLAFNTESDQRVEVVFVSRNDPVSGLRVFKSAQHHGLRVSRSIFTTGRDPFRYLRPLNARLFLSAQPEDVLSALRHGFPAATVYTNPVNPPDRDPEELRIAFDGDAVLFDPSSEAIYQRDGLGEFHRHEAEKAGVPLQPGPFEPFIRALHGLAAHPPAGSPMRIRTALVTARDAPAHERAIRTLMAWDIEVHEAFFLGGVEKRGFLAEFDPDFFFDDQRAHCDPASSVTSTGHVPSFEMPLPNGSGPGAGADSSPAAIPVGIPAPEADN